MSRHNYCHSQAMTTFSLALCGPVVVTRASYLWDCLLRLYGQVRTQQVTISENKHMKVGVGGRLPSHKEIDTPLLKIFHVEEQWMFTFFILFNIWNRFTLRQIRALFAYFQACAFLTQKVLRCTFPTSVMQDHRGLDSATDGIRGECLHMRYWFNIVSSKWGESLCVWSNDSTCEYRRDH